MRPRLLDLFCKAGGAAKGYADAGFEVVGVDIEPQPHYPYEFIQADVFELLTYPYHYTRGLEIAAIHASPPCQEHSELSALQASDAHQTGWMLQAAIQLLRQTHLPWIVENVGGARHALGGQWTVLCGSMFGLQVRRHRLFRSSELLLAPSCRHGDQPEPIDVTGLGGPGGRHRKPRDLAHAREVMGIDWMTRAELSQAIPPAYTRFLGEQLLESVGCKT